MLKTLGVSLVIGAEMGKSYFRVLDDAQKRSKRLGDAIVSTNRKLSAVKDVQKYRTKLQELKAKQEELGGSSKRLTVGIANVEARYKQAKREARSYGVSVLGAAKAQARLEQSSKRMSRQLKARANMQQSAAKLTAMRGQMLGVSAGLYGFGRLAGDANRREESALYLRSVLNAKDKDAALANSQDHARRFAMGSLASETDVLGIEYQLNSAGLDAQVAQAGTEVIHKLAKVTRGGSEQVAEVVGVTFNNLGNALTGTDSERFAQIGDTLAKVQLKYQIRDFGQLGESMKYGASTAASYKVEFAQTAAVLGQLNSAGLQGSMAGTAFSAVMRNMGKASAELGFDMVRGADGQLDMIATLRGLQAELDGMDTDERANLLQNLFGDEGKRGIVPLLDQLDQLAAGYQEVAAAGKSGLVNAEYERFLKSGAGQTEMLWQNLATLGAVFAGTLLPALNIVLGAGAKVAGWAAVMIERFPVIGWVAGALAAGFIAVGAAQAIWTAGIWATNAALAVSPVGWIVGAIVAVVAVLGLLWKNWDAIWGWIQEKSLWVWGYLKKMFAWSPIGLMMKSWKPVMKFLGVVGDKIGALFGRSKKVAARTAAAATVAASPLPALADSMPPLAQRGNTSMVSGDTAIAIHAVEGQSAQDIAAEVSRELDARERKKAAQYRGRMMD